MISKKAYELDAGGIHMKARQTTTHLRSQVSVQYKMAETLGWAIHLAEGSDCECRGAFCCVLLVFSYLIPKINNKYPVCHLSHFLDLLANPCPKNLYLSAVQTLAIAYRLFPDVFSKSVKPFFK